MTERPEDVPVESRRDAMPDGYAVKCQCCGEAAIHGKPCPACGRDPD